MVFKATSLLATKTKFLGAPIGHSCDNFSTKKITTIDWNTLKI